MTGLMAACAGCLPLADRKARLEALPGYVLDGDMSESLAELRAVDLIAATNPHPEQVWADLLDAYTTWRGLDDGLVTWREVEPGLTGWADRHQVALDLAWQRVEQALRLCLCGPGGA